VVVADAGENADLEPEASGAHRDIGRAAAEILGKARHVLEPPADLLAIDPPRRGGVTRSSARSSDRSLLFRSAVK
jgi:hypothetical protein